LDNGIEDKKSTICKLCLDVREVEEHRKIQKDCLEYSFFIALSIDSEPRKVNSESDFHENPMDKRKKIRRFISFMIK